MDRFNLPGATLLIFAVLTTVAPANIIHVPVDEPTVQAGIDAAGSTDTVLVAPGTYVENVFINTSSILLASHFILDGNPAHIAATILDGSSPTSPDTGSVIILLNSSATIQGFTITGGTGTIWLDQSDGLLYREGGGILTEGGNPVICNNVLIKNAAYDKPSGVRSAGGGAIRCGFGSSAQILNNIIAYNKGRYGGGVVAFHNWTSLRNNVIYRNSGGEDYGGGGLWITSSGGSIVENNAIVENTSAFDGGGLLAWANSVTVRNCIFWGNRALYDNQIKGRSGATINVTYCDVEGSWAGTGNIDLDPAFAGPNFLLGPASPCVDAGSPDAAYYDPEDPGSPGSALWPAAGLLRNDMGAFGGPDCVALPVFNAPGIQLDPESVDFDTVNVGEQLLVTIKLEKLGYGWLQVDSVEFRGTWGTDLSSARSYPLILGPAAADSLDSLPVTWEPSTYGAMDDTLLVHHSDAVVPSPLTVALAGHVPGMTGDPNMDGVFTSSDIIYLVNYTFKGGPGPLPVARAGDVNCDGKVTSSDVIFMVNFVFKGGPAPCV